MPDVPLTDTTDDRPDNCNCVPDADLPCWACYRQGYKTANPDAEPTGPRGPDDPPEGPP